jgi:hypothetical protein
MINRILLLLLCEQHGEHPIDATLFGLLPLSLTKAQWLLEQAGSFRAERRALARRERRLYRHDLGFFAPRVFVALSRENPKPVIPQYKDAIAELETKSDPEYNWREVPPGKVPEDEILHQSRALIIRPNLMVSQPDAMEFLWEIRSEEGVITTAKLTEAAVQGFWDRLVEYPSLLSDLDDEGEVEVGSGDMLVGYVNRGESKPRYIVVPNDALEVQIPAVEGRQAFTLVVDTDRVSVMVDGQEVAYYDYRVDATRMLLEPVEAMS